MQAQTEGRIAQLLDKAAARDMDFRYMAVNDLVQELTNNPTYMASDTTGSRIVGALTLLLNDPNREVQNITIQNLPKLIRVLREPNIAQLAQWLMHRLADQTPDPDSLPLPQGIAAMALKTLLAALPTDAPSQVQSVVQTVLPPLASLVTQLELDPPTRDDSDMTGLDLPLDVLDLVGLVFSRFHAYLQPVLANTRQFPQTRSQLMTTLWALVRESDRSSVRKRAVTVVAHLVPFLPESELAALLESLAHQMKCFPTATLDVNMCATARAVLQVLVALGRHCQFQIFPQLPTLVPQVLQLLTRLAPVDHHCVMTEREGVDGDAPSTEVATARDELRDSCLVALDVLSCACNQALAPFLDAMQDLALQYLTYDPNYMDDASTAPILDRLDQDPLSETADVPPVSAEQDSLDHQDYDDWEGSDADDGFGDDNQDFAWMVRRTAARLLATLLRQYPKHLDALYLPICQGLLCRLKEREPTVAGEVIDSLVTLVDVATTRYELGQEGPNPISVQQLRCVLGNGYLYLLALLSQSLNGECGDSALCQWKMALTPMTRAVHALGHFTLSSAVPPALVQREVSAIATVVKTLLGSRVVGTTPGSMHPNPHVLTPPESALVQECLGLLNHTVTRLSTTDATTTAAEPTSTLSKQLEPVFRIYPLWTQCAMHGIPAVCAGALTLAKRILNVYYPVSPALSTTQTKPLPVSLNLTSPDRSGFPKLLFDALMFSLSNKGHAAPLDHSFDPMDTFELGLTDGHIKQVATVALAELLFHCYDQIPDRSMRILSSLQQYLATNAAAVSTRVKVVVVNAWTRILSSPLVVARVAQDEALRQWVTNVVTYLVNELLRQQDKAILAAGLKCVQTAFTHYATQLVGPVTVEPCLRRLDTLLAEADLSIAIQAIEALDSVLAGVAASPSTDFQPWWAHLLQHMIPETLIPMVTPTTGLLADTYVEALGRLLCLIVRHSPDALPTLVDQLFTVGHTVYTAIPGDTATATAMLSTAPASADPMALQYLGQVLTLGLMGATLAPTARSTLDRLTREMQPTNAPLSLCYAAWVTVGLTGQLVLLPTDVRARVKSLVAFTLAAEDQPQTLRLVVSRTLGKLCRGDPTTFQPILMAGLEYLDVAYWFAAREYWSPAAIDGVSQPTLHDAEVVWPLLLASTTSTTPLNDSIRVVMADCLGLIAGMFPEPYLEQLLQVTQTATSHSALIIAMTALRSLPLSSQQLDVVETKLSQHLLASMQLAVHTNTEVQTVALYTLNALVRHFPSVIKAHLFDLLTLLEQAMHVRTELIRSVQMGPFTHQIDDGLDARKSAHECLATLVEALPAQDLPMDKVTASLVLGLQDMADIQNMDLLLLTRLPSMCSRDVLTALVPRLEDLAEPLRKAVNSKPRSNAVQQELDKTKDHIRLGVQAVATLVVILAWTTNRDPTTVVREATDGSSAVAAYPQFHDLVQAIIWQPGLAPVFYQTLSAVSQLNGSSVERL
ncbi:hypothetical protein H4R34_004332 [Dimargaris verticillata]|uniref:TATA-binding protein interacting (TIP20) domain-containing protein n=1 Tax=Dimargaris verticillata TaxID=2761393 RepID=A0A9W8AZ55_9FUNG|nr:hypothetical protein H4R34_004332 [Dimargaris verticillata]